MRHIKFIYSEKATKFCEISTLLLSDVVPVKSKVEILQNFVAFSEYMNFNYLIQNNWSEFATTEGILPLQHRNGEAAILYRFLKKTSRIVLLSLRWSLAEISEGLEIVGGTVC